MGRRLHCSWCERVDVYGSVLWVFLGDNAGDKAVGKVCMGWRSYTFRGIIHLRCVGRKCVGVGDAEASCIGMEKQPIVVAVTTSSGSQSDQYWFTRRPLLVCSLTSSGFTR